MTGKYFIFFFVCCYSRGTGLVQVSHGHGEGDWSHPMQSTGDEIGRKKALNSEQNYGNLVFPEDLLGLYEEEALSRQTNAYFETPNNTKVTVQVGSTAALSCKVFDLADHEMVSWIRQRDHHLITVGSNVYSSDSRFQVVHTEKLKVRGNASRSPQYNLLSEWMLLLHYTQFKDSGIYQCQVSTYPPMGIVMQLEIIELVSEIAGPPERFVQVGSPVMIQCTLKEFTEPPTYIFWYHENRMVNYDSDNKIIVVNKGGTSELRILSVSPESSGNYTCLPSNADASSVFLHVIRGETPAAMQKASASFFNTPLLLALLALLCLFLLS